MVHILHLEDDPVDSQLVQDMLRDAGMEIELERVHTLAAFKEGLQKPGLNLILSDYTIPGMSALEALQLAHQTRPEVPFVFLSGTIGEERAIDTLKRGATDYVLKGSVSRLAPTVRRALKEAEEQVQRKRAEEAAKAARDELARANEALERKVQERTAQLVEANANLQTFAYSAAHDLRAPLRAVTNFTNVILADYATKLDEEVRSLLERVAESAGHMHRLLDDLLEYSRVAGAEVSLGPVSMRGSVREALKFFEGDIRASNATVSVTDPLPDVVGHGATVAVLLTNLLSNALKFVAPGVPPRIHIWAEARKHETGTRLQEPQPAASVTSSPRPSTAAPSTVRLWFEDNGIGIAARDVGRLFSVFQRLHSREAYPGTGLGLAIVKKAAERMGGRVGVESEPGKGSRFWVELPAAKTA